MAAEQPDEGLRGLRRLPQSLTPLTRPLAAPSPGRGLRGANRRRRTPHPSPSGEGKAARSCHASHRRAKRSAMSLDRRVVVDLAGEPGAGRVGEDRAADGEAAHQRPPSARAEGALQLLLRRLEAEQHDAAAPGIVRRDRRRRSPAMLRRGLRLELPPVRLDAERVELGERPRDRVVVERAVLAGDDLDQQLAAEPARRVVEAAERPALLRLQRRDRRRDGRRRGT